MTHYPNYNQFPLSYTPPFPHYQSLPSSYPNRYGGYNQINYPTYYVAPHFSNNFY